MTVQRKRAIVWWSMIIFCLGFWAIVGKAVGQEAKQWDITLGWDANTESDLKEYRLYENTAHVETIPAGTETVTRVLEAGDYEWYLTARDDSLNESGPSQPVGISLDEVPPTMTGTTINIQIGVHVGGQ